MSRKSKGLKKTHPNAQLTSGVVQSYDHGLRKGVLDLADGGTVFFTAQTLNRAGHKNIKIGAQMHCSVHGGEVVGVHVYKLRGQPNLSA